MCDCVAGRVQYNDSQKQKKINELLFFVGSKIVIASFRLLVEKPH